METDFLLNVKYCLYLLEQPHLITNVTTVHLHFLLSFVWDPYKLQSEQVLE
jgi:hypothetical protein